MNLPEWLIYRKKTKVSELEIRKIGDGDAGIKVTKELHEFPGSISAEAFINRENAIEIIEALKEYFNI